METPIMNPLTNAMNTCILECDNFMKLGNQPPANDTKATGSENNTASKYGDTNLELSSLRGPNNINAADCSVFVKRTFSKEKILERLQIPPQFHRYKERTISEKIAVEQRA